MRQIEHSHLPKSLLLVPILALGLSGCISGGGGSGSSTGTGGLPVSGLGLRTIASPESFEDAEYNRSTGLDAINASSAYSVGGTGEGVTVGVIDSGIDTTHSDLSGAIDSNSINIRTNAKGAIGDASSGHGTAVAGVIAARRNGSGTHGVAFDSKILAIRSETPDSCSPGCTFSQDVLARATDYAVNNGARVINYSLGGASGLSSSLRRSLSNAADRNRLLVFSAGNDGNANPTYPGLFATESASDGAAIVVGAVDSSNKIASFSNRAGSAAERYLVAPGVNIRTTKSGGGTTRVSGTSFAAPMVSGAAATIIDAAPHLSSAQVASLLLNTATDLGAKGTDPIYGRGLLNLDAAMSPQGASVVPSGRNVSESGSRLSTTGLSLSSVFGDALRSSLGSAIFLDSYDRGYRFDVGRLVNQRQSSIQLGSWLRPSQGNRAGVAFDQDANMMLSSAGENYRNWSTLERDEHDDSDIAVHLSANLDADRELLLHYGGGSPVQAVAGPSTALISNSLIQTDMWARQNWLGANYSHTFEDGWSADASLAVSGNGRSEASRAQAQVASAGLTHRREKTHAGIQIGQIIEHSAVLDSQGQGVFGLDGDGYSTFVNLYGRLDLGKQTRLSAQALVTRSEISVSSASLITSVDPVISSGFEVWLTTDGVVDVRDSLTFSLSQPQRAETGQASFRLPTARELDGTLVYEARTASLEPSGREIDLEAAYQIALNDRFNVGGNVMLRLQPGHNRNAEPEAIGALRLRYQFH